MLQGEPQPGAGDLPRLPPGLKPEGEEARLVRLAAPAGSLLPAEVLRPRRRVRDRVAGAADQAREAGLRGRRRGDREIAGERADGRLELLVAAAVVEDADQDLV